MEWASLWIFEHRQFEDVFPTGNRGFSHCHGYVVLEDTPLKTNMEHDHQGLENHVPF